MLTGLSLSAADITKGYTFTTGERNVTHTKLNNLVDGASINTSFFTDKTATTSPTGADLLLLYSAGSSAYRKISVGNLLLNNADLIIEQTEDASPATNDWLLTYDVSGNALAKVRYNNLLSHVWDHDRLINARTQNGTPSDTNAFLLSYDAGTFSKLSRSNLFYNFASFASFQNLDAITTLVPASDSLWIYSAGDGASRKIGLPKIREYIEGSPGTIVTSGSFWRAGMVAQVLGATKTDTQTIGTGAWTDITGLSVAITPLNASSVVLVRATVNGSSTDHAFFRLVRDSTPIGLGNAAGSRVVASSGDFYNGGNSSVTMCLVAEVIDEPTSAVAVTYRVQVFGADASTFINRSTGDADNDNQARSISTLIVQDLVR
jgi:hypothetical protein